jgi:hypothetical protein
VRGRKGFEKRNMKICTCGQCRVQKQKGKAGRVRKRGAEDGMKNDGWM